MDSNSTIIEATRNWSRVATPIKPGSFRKVHGEDTFVCNQQTKECTSRGEKNPYYEFEASQISDRGPGIRGYYDGAKATVILRFSGLAGLVGGMYAHITIPNLVEKYQMSTKAIQGEDQLVSCGPFRVMFYSYSTSMFGSPEATFKVRRAFSPTSMRIPCPVSVLLWNLEGLRWVGGYHFGILIGDPDEPRGHIVLEYGAGGMFKSYSSVDNVTNFFGKILHKVMLGETRDLFDCRVDNDVRKMFVEDWPVEKYRLHSCNCFSFAEYVVQALHVVAPDGKAITVEEFQRLAVIRHGFSAVGKLGFYKPFSGEAVWRNREARGDWRLAGAESERRDPHTCYLNSLELLQATRSDLGVPPQRLFAQGG